jgi:hypothetical protein
MSEIYEFLTGDTNTMLKFHFSWIIPDPSYKIEINPKAFLQGPPWVNPTAPIPVQPTISAPSPASSTSHDLRLHKSINYRALCLAQEIQPAGKKLK